jgi:hypothetical protein
MNPKMSSFAFMNLSTYSAAFPSSPNNGRHFTPPIHVHVNLNRQSGPARVVLLRVVSAKSPHNPGIGSPLGWLVGKPEAIHQGATGTAAPH